MKLIAHVYGKHGCKKCELLKSRLQKLLEKDEYKDISMNYSDVLTLDGIVAFCKVKCLNPNRIPALVMETEQDGVIKPVPSAHRKSLESQVFGAGVVYSYIGVQTDYDNGGGVISPAMIESVLTEAKTAVE